jgi:hypothetical protein
LTVLKKQRRFYAKSRNEIQKDHERTARLKIDGPDKSDVAGAIRRAEIQSLLRGMKPEEQSQFFACLGDDISSEIAAAVIEMPAEFSAVAETAARSIEPR